MHDERRAFLLGRDDTDVIFVDIDGRLEINKTGKIADLAEIVFFQIKKWVLQPTLGLYAQ
jgi:hypothetical protein